MWELSEYIEDVQPQPNLPTTQDWKMADVNVGEVPDLSKLKVPDLKKELKNRGLSTSGNKNELMERLQAALKMTESAGADSVDDLDEDLLNDDDDDHLESTDSVIHDIDRALSDSATQSGQKRKLSESQETDAERKDDAKPAPTKKVILNRNTPSIHLDPSPEKTPTSDGELKDDAPKADKKIIKFSELSAKERLELRAKKFGVTLSGEAKKVARIERFMGSNNSTSSNSSIAKSPDANLDVLKQRAARFGCSVSSLMTKIENQEKLEKRKARFGAASESNGLSQSEKAQLRLERFKQPVT